MNDQPLGVVPSKPSKALSSNLVLWTYRDFILGSVKRDFQLRYRNSLLGAAWTILNPLAMMLVYTLVFSQVMQARLPGNNSPYAYSIFLISGLLPWSLFADIVSRGPNLFIDQANLIKKIQFPKIALLLIAVINSLINFGIIFGLFLVFLGLSSQFPGWVILAVLPSLLLLVALGSSLCLILALLNVFFRDVAQLTNIALQFGFWLTPIVYSKTILPTRYQYYLSLNPLANIFESFHVIFIEYQVPKWASLAGACILCLILTSMAIYLFHKRSAEMVDEL
jgi:lipopolysaccharide transport system permease protein